MAQIWQIYKGVSAPHNGIETLPPPPSWRQFSNLDELETTKPFISDSQKTAYKQRFGKAVYQASINEINMVNMALLLRRPLLVTGKPGSGKSSLAHAIAYELQLGPVQTWSITSRSSLIDALYSYDAIGRLHAYQIIENSDKQNKVPHEIPIGKFVRLGPLGTALLPRNIPRVLLIDEIDKSDIDLPNDLLNVFEEGEFIIPELARHPQTKDGIDITNNDGNMTSIKNGHIRCHAFPFVIITSNGERELPPAFLRRCLRLDIAPPNPEKLAKIVEQYFHQGTSSDREKREQLLHAFLEKRKFGDLSTDQLLNAVFLMSNNVNLDKPVNEEEQLLNSILRYINE